MKKYEESINGFRQQVATSQHDIMHGLRQDYSQLDREIQKTQQQAEHETRQLESGIQLDMSLETKRRTETKMDVDKRVLDVGWHADTQSKALEEELVQVSRQARTGIIAFASAALISLVIFHSSSA